jgi:GDPmannose 4,6-dehydratase
MEIKEIEECRICGNQNLIPILDLGSHALSGRFPKGYEMDPPMAPLQLVKCDDSKEDVCGLLQLKHGVESDELYLHDYGYRSGLNDTMTNHLKDIAEEVEKRINFSEGDIVLDVGSNDATLLKAYNAEGVKKIGIDPTGKQFEKFYTEDIKLVKDYFSSESFFRVFPEERAKVITSLAMFYDLENPMEFISHVKSCLDAEGLWVFEQSYMPLMLERDAFDTICHEHLEYYSLKQIKWMLDKNDFKIVDVDFNDTNGGSFRITAAPKNSKYLECADKINEIFENERKIGLDTLQPYEEFKNRIEKAKLEITRFLKEEKSKGKSIYIYGASTKGNTLLQYFGIDSRLITAAAERNPEKFGRRTPLTGIPIISEEEARLKKPDYFIVLPWHFKEEFVKREEDYLKSGGKFIFPLPTFEVVGLELNKEKTEKKKALITGITGQIGSYLAELLIEKGYEVHGLVRRTSSFGGRLRIEHIRNKINLIYGDLGDSDSLDRIIHELRPDEIYNLAAQSHVQISFETPDYTSDVNAMGVLRICEVVRRINKPIKIYQASTSELYGGIYNTAVNEETPFYPKSPYGVAKLYAYWITKNYREAYGMFCCNGIVFNTESPRRGENFVTRKITLGIADIMKGKMKTLKLGNLNARRDWSHAKDSARAMWMIMQAEKPDDYVIASGESRSIREFVEIAFNEVGIEIGWKGEGIHEVGFDRRTGRVLVEVNEKYFRPLEVNSLEGNPEKARRNLGWKKEYSFQELVREMMENDLK